MQSEKVSILNYDVDFSFKWQKSRLQRTVLILREFARERESKKRLNKWIWSARVKTVWQVNNAMG